MKSIEIANTMSKSVWQQETYDDADWNEWLEKEGNEEKIFAMCNQQYCVSLSLQSCSMKEIQFNWSVYFRQLNLLALYSVLLWQEFPALLNNWEGFVCFIHSILQIVTMQRILLYLIVDTASVTLDTTFTCVYRQIGFMFDVRI